MAVLQAGWRRKGAERDGYWPPLAPSVNATEQKSQNPPEPKFCFFLNPRARLGAPLGRPKSSPASMKNRIQATPWSRQFLATLHKRKKCKTNKSMANPRQVAFCDFHASLSGDAPGALREHSGDALWTLWGCFGKLWGALGIRRGRFS